MVNTTSQGSPSAHASPKKSQSATLIKSREEKYFDGVKAFARYLRRYVPELKTAASLELVSQSVGAESWYKLREAIKERDSLHPLDSRNLSTGIRLFNLLPSKTNRSHRILSSQLRDSPAIAQFQTQLSNAYPTADPLAAWTAFANLHGFDSFDELGLAAGEEPYLRLVQVEGTKNGFIETNAGIELLEKINGNLGRLPVGRQGEYLRHEVALHPGLLTVQSKLADHIEMIAPYDDEGFVLNERLVSGFEYFLQAQFASVESIDKQDVILRLDADSPLVQTFMSVMVKLAKHRIHRGEIDEAEKLLVRRRAYLGLPTQPLLTGWRKTSVFHPLPTFWWVGMSLFPSPIGVLRMDDENNSKYFFPLLASYEP